VQLKANVQLASAGVVTKSGVVRQMVEHGGQADLGFRLGDSQSSRNLRQGSCWFNLLEPEKD
jgi:hypothetical protein